MEESKCIAHHTVPFFKMHLIIIAIHNLISYINKRDKSVENSQIQVAFSQ